jgi:hypothetical protein
VRAGENEGLSAEIVVCIFPPLEVLFLQNRPQSPCKENITKSGFKRLESLPSNPMDGNCIFPYQKTAAFKKGARSGSWMNGRTQVEDLESTRVRRIAQNALTAHSARPVGRTEALLIPELVRHPWTVSAGGRFL